MGQSVAALVHAAWRNQCREPPGLCRGLRSPGEMNESGPLCLAGVHLLQVLIL